MNSFLPRYICLQAILLTCLAAVLPTAAQQPGTNTDMHTQPEKGFRHYVLRIDYAETTVSKPAPLTLYYTDPMQNAPDYTPC